MNLAGLLGVAKVNPGIDPEALLDLRSEFIRTLPSSYMDMLRSSDGFSLLNGVVVYSAEELSERNATFEVDAYMPGYLAIGDDSGGRCIVIPFGGDGVFVVDQGIMDTADMRKVGSSLQDWIAKGAAIDRT